MNWAASIRICWRASWTKHPVGDPVDAASVMREALATSAIRSSVRRSAGPARQPHHPGVQGFQRAGSSPFTPSLQALRLSTASRPDRGRHGQQGHRGVDGGARRAAAARHQRHDPHLPHAGAEWRPDASNRRAGDPADDGAALLFPARERLSRMWPHDERLSRCSPSKIQSLYLPRCPPGAGPMRRGA